MGSIPTYSTMARGRKEVTTSVSLAKFRRDPAYWLGRLVGQVAKFVEGESWLTEAEWEFREGSSTASVTASCWTNAGSRYITVPEPV